MFMVFTKLTMATRLSMYVHECMLCSRIYRLKYCNARCMYVCMYVCKYVCVIVHLWFYRIQPHDAILCFPQTLRQRCFFLVSLKSPIGLKRKIYLKADTHGVLVYYYTQKFYIWKWTLGLLAMERIERADDDKLVYVVNPLDYMRFCFIN